MTGAVGAVSAPILVLGSGQRCGSTLVQRLLSSHPDLLIWGEHGGVLGTLFQVRRRLSSWESMYGGPARGEFLEDGFQSFMANVTPPPEYADAAAAAFLIAMFAAPARALGRRRWGVKEVRYGRAEAAEFARLFPDTRVLHITRDPRNVVVSLEWWERSEVPWTRRDTRTVVARWKRINGSFAHAEPQLDHLLGVRYEDLVADGGGTASRIAGFLGLDLADMDLSVLDRKIHSGQALDGGPRQLTEFTQLAPELRGLLDDPELIGIAEAFGYAL
jgi:hypothetical protein